MSGPTNNFLLDQLVYFYRFLKRFFFKDSDWASYVHDAPIIDYSNIPSGINYNLSSDKIRDAFGVYVKSDSKSKLVHLVDSEQYVDFINENKYLVRFRKGHQTNCKGGAIYFCVKSALFSHVLVVGKKLGDWWLIPSESKDVLNYMEIVRKI